MTFSAVATGRRGACCSAELTPCSARSAWYRSRFSFLDQSAYRPRAHRILGEDTDGRAAIGAGVERQRDRCFACRKSDLIVKGRPPSTVVCAPPLQELIEQLRLVRL